MPPKKLFEEDEENTAPRGDVAAPVVRDRTPTLAINAKYADAFDKVKRKQELQRLTAKYGDDSSSTDSDDAESSDGEAQLINDDHDEEFADLLVKLRKNDPAILDKSAKFFTEAVPAPETSDNPKKKAFTLADAYRRDVTAGSGFEDDESHRPVAVAGDEAARRRFLDKAKSLDTAGEPSAADFTVKPSATAAEDSVPLIRKKGKKFQKAFRTREEDDENERFLKTFFGLEAWREDPTASKDKDLSWEEAAANDADEDFFDDAEQWERTYQEQKYRHEEGLEAQQIQTFPRHEDGLLRQQPTTRQDARERKKERQQEAYVHADEEVKRLKALKRKEIDEQRARVRLVAGLDDRAAGKLAQLDLSGDYDPAAFDAMMATLFDDEYYDNIDDAEIEQLDKEEAEGVEFPAPRKGDTGEGEASVGDDDDFALLYPTSYMDRQAGGDAVDVAHADTVDAEDAASAASADVAAASNGTKLAAVRKLEEDLDKKVDEYWKLHYHKIAGDVRTRFRYRDVFAEHFGLSDVDVLTMDDRSLNMIAPLRSYAAYTVKQQNIKDRFRSLHRRGNVRLLDADVRTRRYGKDTVAIDLKASPTPAAAAASSAEAASGATEEGEAAAPLRGRGAPRGRGGRMEHGKRPRDETSRK